MSKAANKKYKNYIPMVSVCTPTFNRRPFIPMMIECYKNQTYQQNKMEWIIVDDGTDKIADLIDEAKKTIPNIKYFALDRKMRLGEKRNFMHKHCTGSIIVYMDDDDYYPPERVQHAVDTLMNNKEALCAGSSELYIYFKHINQMIQCGPYGPNHATAGTFAFKSRLLDDTKYNDEAALAEEKEFLKNYTVPFVQLDPMKTILVFSHEHNTFDKRKLLENPHPDFLKESEKTVDMFIRGPHAAKIKQFFLKDINKALAKYEPGDPKMKPDVLEQTKQIDEQRKKMAQEQQAQAQGQMMNGPPQIGGVNISIMKNEPGKPPVEMTAQEVVTLLQTLSNENEELKKKLADAFRTMDTMKVMMTAMEQKLATEGLKVDMPGVVNPNYVEPPVSKSMPEVMVDL